MNTTMTRQLRNILVLIGVVALPMLGQRFAGAAGLSDYTQSILYKVALNITLSVGLSLIIGFAGQFSMGHAGFMSLGAFFAAMFSSQYFLSWTAGYDPAWLESAAAGAVLLRTGLLVLTMLVGMAAAGVASVLIGLPALRLRGDYLAIATLGFGEIVYNLLITYLQKAHSDSAYYMPYQIGFMSRTVNLASSWTLALVAILVTRNLLSSTAGRALPAIREDEIASGAVGIRTTRYKMLAFVIGSLMASAAGVLESHQTNSVNPASYRFDRSIEMIVPVVLGGSGSLSGCVLASAALTYLLERLRELPSDAQQYRTIVYAGVLVLVMVLRPQGLMGRLELSDLARRAFSRLRKQPPGPRPGVATSSGLLDLTRPVRDGAALECSRLTIRFGGLTAVNNFKLCLRDGEIVGLIGPNGAGKTTCFNMITGVYRPTEGEIRLGGHSVVGCNTARINARGIARTFQNIRLFSELSVLDNVQVAMHARLRTGVFGAILRTPAFYREEQLARERASELLGIFGLARVQAERACNLSYGDQRRLEIARALATRPRILCLDEPAAGMNPAEKRDLMRLIRDVRDRFHLTVLLIEHDMKVVMGVCERITVLDHGEIIAEGAPADIRNNPKVIEAYLGEAPR